MSRIKVTIIGFSNTAKIFILVSFLTFLWLPLAFLNFDPHHDGLILSTIRLSKQSILSGGDYPFNQYGVFWTLPFLIISFIAKDDFLFVAMRLATICIYLVSAFILFKSSKFFLKDHAWIPAILFLASQPFVTDIGSDLVPWPSAVIMPLVLVLFYNAMKSLSKGQRPQNMFFLGFLLPPILFTRVQIGILAIVGVSVVFLYCRGTRFLSWILFGFATSGLAIVSFLIRLNWLSSALYDELVFGLTYLSADKSTFPKPIFTLVGVLMVLSALFGASFLRTTASFTFKNGLLLFLPIFFLGSALIYVIRTRELDFLPTLVLVTRRTWIVLTLGVVLFFVLKITLGALKEYSAFGLFLVKHKDSIVLAVFAIVMQSQAYPLFDQMHFWWGSPISFLVMTVVVQEIFRELEISGRFKNRLTVIFSCLIVFSLVIPWLNQITKEKFEYPSAIGAKVYSVGAAVREQEQVQNFFSETMPKGSLVLNLCDDTNVFFSASNFKPSSRFFVFWAEQMSHADLIFEDMRSSGPEYVVSCDLTHAPSLRLSQEKTRDRLIDSIGKNISLVDSYEGLENKKWFIYKVDH